MRKNKMKPGPKKGSKQSVVFSSAAAEIERLQMEVLRLKEENLQIRQKLTQLVRSSWSGIK